MLCCRPRRREVQLWSRSPPPADARRQIAADLSRALSGAADQLDIEYVTHKVFFSLLSFFFFFFLPQKAI